MSNLIDKYLKQNEIKIGYKIKYGPFNWHVIKIEDTKLLIMASQIIATIPYSRDISWEHSSIRSYLNYILNNEFTEEEQDNIIEVELATELINTVEVTKDKLFILTAEEIEQLDVYLKIKKYRYEIGNINCYKEEDYWTRSIYSCACLKTIKDSGEIGFSHIENNKGVVPCCYIDKKYYRYLINK